jgi:hypothetical protein
MAPMPTALLEYSMMPRVRVACLAAVMFCIALVSLPSHALVNMAQGENIDLAIRYGVKMQDAGVQAMLGDQWREGPDGMLLNVYTPFMVLASKAARSNTPSNPTLKNLQATKRKLQRTITDMRDPHYPPLVKFVVALYGDNVAFGLTVNAEVRGLSDKEPPRPVALSKQLRPRVAVQSDPERNPNLFEAVNAYYFKADDLAKFDQFEFVVTQPGKDPVVFKFSTAQLY